MKVFWVERYDEGGVISFYSMRVFLKGGVLQMKYNLNLSINKPNTTTQRQDQEQQKGYKYRRQLGTKLLIQRINMILCDEKDN